MEDRIGIEKLKQVVSSYIRTRTRVLCSKLKVIHEDELEKRIQRRKKCFKKEV